VASARGGCALRVRVASARGECAWRVRVASACGECAWRMCVANVRGECAWRVRVAIIRGNCALKSGAPCDFSTLPPRNKYYGICFANKYISVHNICGAPSIDLSLNQLLPFHACMRNIKCILCIDSYLLSPALLSQLLH
jgi:hypothetical protein